MDTCALLLTSDVEQVIQCGTTVLTVVVNHICIEWDNGVKKAKIAFTKVYIWIQINVNTLQNVQKIICCLTIHKPRCKDAFEKVCRILEQLLLYSSR